METYTLPSVKQTASGNLLYDSGKLKLGFSNNLEGWDCWGYGREVQKVGDICIPMADSCLYMAETNTILSSNQPPIKNNFLKKDTCPAVFIAALFTIAKMWKQPKGPSTNEWIKKMWYIHAMEYHSALKRMKQCHLQQHGWRIRSEVSQKEKDKYHLIALICGI